MPAKINIIIYMTVINRPSFICIEPSNLINLFMPSYLQWRPLMREQF